MTKNIKKYGSNKFLHTVLKQLTDISTELWQI